ncbi:MAG: PQQ-binding-like beta-propeller repeat protein [Phenylobacterium sp.]
MRFGHWEAAAAALGVLLVAAPAAMAQAQAASAGEAVFGARCKACHDPAVERAPSRTALAAYRPEQIVDALTNGVMKPMAAGLTDADKQAVAAFLTAGQQQQARNRFGAGPVGVDQKCATNPPIRETGSDWTSVGVDASSRRFQRNPGLKAADVPRLKLKWAFAMPGGGMPTVVGDWLFTTNRNGRFYALDAKTGCVRWVVEGVGSRTTPAVAKSSISPSGWAIFEGERNRTVRAFDATTGKELWKSPVLEANPVAGVTGAPLLVGDQLFVPLTSGEEGAGRQPTYPCCSFRGSLAALDAKTGKLQWQTAVVTEPLHPIRKTANGTQLQGPAGGAIWSAPTADPKRGLVFVATGDSYTDAPTKGADAIVAMEMKTGKVRWSNQVTASDNFIMGCNEANKAANCPTPVGPDYDFGASPILFHLGSGKDVLLAGQKSGAVYGMDPDTGRTLWTRKVGSGSALGGVEWGMAADDKRLYVAISDVINLADELMRPKGAPVWDEPLGPAKPGLYALDPATGKVVWSTPAPVAPCHYAGDRSRDLTKGACLRAQSAAPSVMPGVVISGTMDGWLRGYDAGSGKVLWAYSTTAQTYETTNGIKDQPGGNIDGLGPAIAGGMVYVQSGWLGAANTGGNPVNVLLAFSVDGK